MRRVETEVLVIGGGATGAGIARDLAMRGIVSVLVDRHDWANGTTGRYQGLMHTGSRYSLKDLHTARECIQENRILRKIMPHCIEDTGGFVVATPGDDPNFGDHLMDCCHQAGIPIEEVPVAAALREEPFVNPGITRCLRLPSATADSFLATKVNVESARQHGARAWNYHEVMGLLVKSDRIIGVVCRDRTKDEPVEIHADLVINAAGAWASRIAAMAGISIPVICSKGSMIATHHRIINTVILRMRWPSDCDSVLPCHSVSVLGCTDVIVDDPDRFGVEPGEIDVILEECGQLVPAVRDMRKIRAWAGVRPLYRSTDVEGSTGRQLSRSHVILDHETLEGISGMLTIVGGKWTTYRLMAEQVVDQVCTRFGTVRECRTHLEPLPGGENGTYHWQAAPLAQIEATHPSDQLVCECELVTEADVKRSLLEERAKTIDDVRRSTRLGMGTCQGGYCTYRVAGLMHKIRRPPVEETNVALRDFVQERWKGIVPIVAGEQLRQMRFNELILRDLLNVDHLPGPRSSELGGVTMYQPSGLNDIGQAGST